MNRKERRAAQKQGKAAPGAGSPLGAPGDNLFAAAVHQFRAGQLGEAERLCRDVLLFDPDHFDSLHLLGFMAYQTGRDDIAVDLLRRAAAVNGRSPDCHFHLALVLHRSDRLDDAVAHFTQATALKRDHVAAHMNLGNVFMQQARFEQARAAYQRVLALEPHSADARLNLGNTFMRESRPSEAETHYRRAVELQPAHVGALTNLGLVLQSQSRHEQAVDCFRRAIAAKPDAAEAHRLLGDALSRLGHATEAAGCYQQALNLQPTSVEAHYGLANLVMEQGQPEQAVAGFRRALALKPDYAEVCNNLGIALVALGHDSEAEAQYRRAIALKPELVDVYRNLGRVILAQGDVTAALALADRALAVEQTAEARAFFADCAKKLAVLPAGADFRALIARALLEGWSRPSELSAVAADLIKSSAAGKAAIELAAEVRRKQRPAADLFASTALADIAMDEPLCALLVSAPVRDIELERFLTTARLGLLDAALACAPEHPVAPQHLAFFCALAQQCFINEYVFARSEDEWQRVRQLQEKLAGALTAAAPIAVLWLSAVAAYLPLHSLAEAPALMQRRWPEPVGALLTQQLQEPLAERGLRDTIAALTTIDDDVSLMVRRQYEEMPYPRWVRPAVAAKATTIDWSLRNRFPLAPLRSLGKRNDLEILVAGCGTGQHSIDTARRYSGAKVLAVDLSLTSLAYAKRKTQALGLTNVDYAQADILKLGSIGRTFDVIEASGVLHHLGDPAAGWRVLLSLLRPGGLMNVGLYSALARRDIRTARAFIADQHYGQTADDIRRCRQEMIACEDGTPLRNVTKYSDFFSTSECRDLLFHVQEHQLTIPEIERFLSDNDLTFLGFTGDVDQGYRKHFPQDRAMTNLAQWHAFETENPVVFANMYQFWVQKPPAPAQPR